MTEANESKREDRKKNTAEIFTPPILARQMLNKLPRDVWKPGKTFIDPSVGSGNFLIAVLWRKIERGHDPHEALKTIFGVDIMRDNVQECKLRLLKLVSLYDMVFVDDVIAVLTNIVWISATRHEGGALDYDFAFKSKPKQADIDRWIGWVDQGRLNEVDLPVEEEHITGEYRDMFE